MSTRVTLVAEPRACHALAPLVGAWEAEGTVRVRPAGGRTPGGDELVALADEADAVLVVGARHRSPRTVLPGPVVRARDGRAVPVAWLPDTGPAALGRFAIAAARVHERARSDRTDPRTVLVLSQRHRKFGDLADRMVRVLEDDGGDAVRCRRMTAYDVHRDDLVESMSTGPALSVYVGHGRSIGWVGYAGLRAHHVGTHVDPDWLPGGAVLSLTCRTASRHRTGLSFAEAIPLGGVAAAALGAVGPTLHTANARWALRVGRALGSVTTIGQLLAAVAPHDPEAGAYRLLGDPTAPLLDDPARAVAAPLEEAS